MPTPNSATIPTPFPPDAVVRPACPDQAEPKDSRLRLSLSASFGRAALDGAWWPRTRKLETELSDLVDHFPAAAGHIVHAVYSVPDWLPAHRRINVKHRVIKVGSFPHDDSHRILLGLANRQSLQLMVVPPESSSSLALAVMAKAASPTNRDSAAAILANAQEREAAETAARWSDDGGLWWEPRPSRYVRRGKWRT
jgi:hypothetical protein